MIIIFVIGDPLWLTEVTKYKILIKLYKNLWISNVLSGDCVHVVFETSNIGRKNVKIFQIDLLSCNTSDFAIKYSFIRQPSEHNIYGSYINMFRHIHYLAISSACYIITFKMWFTSRGEHVWLSSFYTHKHISTILIICLPIFDVSIHNLDTITGQDIIKPTIFKRFYTNLV